VIVSRDFFYVIDSRRRPGSIREMAIRGGTGNVLNHGRTKRMSLYDLAIRWVLCFGGGGFFCGLFCLVCFLWVCFFLLLLLLFFLFFLFDFGFWVFFEFCFFFFVLFFFFCFVCFVFYFECLNKLTIKKFFRNTIDFLIEANGIKKKRREREKILKKTGVWVLFGGVCFCVCLVGVVFLVFVVGLVVGFLGFLVWFL